jgi:RES domain
MVATDLNAFELAPLPPGGIFRLSEWSAPLDPPPPPAPLGAIDPEYDSSGRWDAPEEEFSTLYCATEAEGCFGEKLGPFIPRPEAVLEIEEFLEGEPDEEPGDDDLTSGLNRTDISMIGWKLAWAPSDPEGRAFDVTATRTWVSLLPSIASILRAVGLPLNRAALKSSRRGVTRRIAGKLYEASRGDDGGLRASGIRYESRRPPAWECWALWEPLPLNIADATVEEVTINHPALRSAAAKLGVPLYA